MDVSNRHLQALKTKMTGSGLPPLVIETFVHYYEKVRSGETGMIPDAQILPVAPGDLEKAEGLAPFAPAG